MRKIEHLPTSIGTTAEIPYLKSQQLKEYGFHRIEKLSVSPDGTRAAFTIGSIVPGNKYVFADSLTFGPFENRLSSFRFSPDSSQLMFVSGIKRGRYSSDKDYLPINPIGSQLYVKKRDMQDLSLSPPAQNATDHYLNSTYAPIDFLVYKDTNNRPKEYILDTQTKAIIKTIRPGCDGGNICRPSTKRLVIDKNGTQYSHPVIGETKSSSSGIIINPVLSQNKKKLAYLSKDRGFIVMVGDIEGTNTSRGEEYDEIVEDSVRFSDDGKYIGYGATRDEKIYWVVEKVEE